MEIPFAAGRTAVKKRGFPCGESKYSTPLSTL